MNNETMIMMALLLIILFEVSYLLYKVERTSTRSKNTAIYVDTSVLIDGRILSIAETGFITSELVIPRSVIGELQLLADGSDHEKRARARKGLDVAKKLRELDAVEVRLLQDGSQAREGVDDRLISLAKKHGGSICTIDYNLNKVAQVEGISVLNVNELAKNLRMSYLPGETYRLELTQKGHDNHQAVGYLPDGTMVVVESAAAHIGTTQEIEFIRALQTDAGRMMFAKIVTRSVPSTNKKPTAKRPQGRAQHHREVKDTKVSGTRAKTSRQNNRDQPYKNTKQTNEDRLINLVENQRS